MGKRRRTRAALYARVSTDKQEHGLQLDALRQVAKQRGWKAKEYIDQASGTGAKLPERERLMADARAGKVDVAVTWRFDRFARSTKDLLDALDSFRSWGVEFVSLQEGIDTSTPTGKAMFGMCGVFGQLERDLVVERTKAGLAAARRRGKRLGRPRALGPQQVVRARRLAQRKTPVRKIAATLGVSKSAVHRALRG